MNTTPVTEVSTEWAETVVPVAAPTRGDLRRARARHLAQRGMVTAEYAVGILAAIALALVLMQVFQHDTFKTTLLRQVTQLIGQIGKSIK